MEHLKDERLIERFGKFMPIVKIYYLIKYLFHFLLK